MSGRSVSATRDHVNQLSHGELMNPHHKVDSDPMLPVIRTSLHTNAIKPDPTPSTDPELFDKSTGHSNSHYDHSKTLSKKKRAKMYGTGSPQQTQRPSNMKVDHVNILDEHAAQEHVEHDKDTWDHNTAKSKDATVSARENQDQAKHDEVSSADKPDTARKEKPVATNDATQKSAKQQKESDEAEKSSDSSDKSSEESESTEDSEKGMLGRAADRAVNLASGLLGSMKETMSSLTGKSEETSNEKQANKEQKS